MVTTESIYAAEQKYGVATEHSTVRQLAAKGREWIVAEVAKIKALPQNDKTAQVLATARVAWEVAS